MRCRPLGKTGISVSGGNKTHKTDNGNRSSTEFSDGSVSVLVTYICENTSEIRLDITHEPLYQAVSCTFFNFMYDVLHLYADPA